MHCTELNLRHAVKCAFADLTQINLLRIMVVLSKTCYHLSHDPVRFSATRCSFWPLSFDPVRFAATKWSFWPLSFDPVRFSATRWSCWPHIQMKSGFRCRPPESLQCSSRRLRCVKGRNGRDRVGRKRRKREGVKRNASPLLETFHLPCIADVSWSEINILDYSINFFYS